MNILECIQLYVENYNTMEEYNKPLTEKKSFDDWKKYMTFRAQVVAACFYDNNELLEFMREYAKNEIPDDVLLQINEKLLDMYNSGFNDAEVYLIFWPIVLDYYKDINDINNVIATAYRLSYVKNEMFARSSGEEADYSLVEFVLSFRNIYSELSELGKKIIMSSFVMNVVSLTSLSKDFKKSFQHSYKAYLEYVDFKENVLSESERQSDLFMQFDSFIPIAFMTNANNPENLSEEALAYLSNMINEAYSSLDTKDYNEIPTELLEAYMNTCIENKTKSTQEAIDILFEHFINNPDNIPNPDTNYEIAPYNSASAIYNLLKKCPKTEHNKEIYATISKRIHEACSINYVNLIPLFSAAVLAAWTEETLSYNEGVEIKEKLIFKNIIKTQIPTYLHSSMVSRIAVEIVKCAYNKNKCLFNSLNMSYEEIIEFTRRAGLFHDFGKIKIPYVINKQERKLCDYEFNSIKMHPQSGWALLSENSDLAQFKDPIMFHHRWYNEKGGYPNINEPRDKERIITDIITLADCLDAASDNLGRNYKSSKKITDVIEEFKSGAGTRYNPDFVSIISESDELIDKLKKIAEEDRIQLMYDSYLEGINM